MGGRMEGDLVEASQIDDWERTLFSKVYTALSQQTDQEYESIHFYARAHYIEVPSNLSRQESIELGQYLFSKIE
jgi:hypothetical protein